MEGAIGVEVHQKNCSAEHSKLHEAPGNWLVRKMLWREHLRKLEEEIRLRLGKERQTVAMYAESS
jgi:hypothetical protein